MQCCHGHMAAMTTGLHSGHLHLPRSKFEQAERTMSHDCRRIAKSYRHSSSSLKKPWPEANFVEPTPWEKALLRHEVWRASRPILPNLMKPPVRRQRCPNNNQVEPEARADDAPQHHHPPPHNVE